MGFLFILLSLQQLCSLWAGLHDRNTGQTTATRLASICRISSGPIPAVPMDAVALVPHLPSFSKLGLPSFLKVPPFPENLGNTESSHPSNLQLCAYAGFILLQIIWTDLLEKIFWAPGKHAETSYSFLAEFKDMHFFSAARQVFLSLTSTSSINYAIDLKEPRVVCLVEYLKKHLLWKEPCWYVG